MATKMTTKAQLNCKEWVIPLPHQHCWADRHGDTALLGSAHPGRRAVLPAPIDQRAQGTHSSYQRCASVTSPSTRLKPACESLLSPHGNSTSQKGQRMSNTRHNKQSFPTPTFLAARCKFTLSKTPSSSPNLRILTLCSQRSVHRVCI